MKGDKESFEGKTPDEILNEIQKAYDENRKLMSFLNNLSEEVLKAILIDIALMVPALIVAILVYLNLFKNFWVNLFVLSVASIFSAALALLLVFYLSLANIFREVMFLKPMIELPSVNSDVIELIGDKLRGHQVKAEGMLNPHLTFLPLASEEEVYEEEVFGVSGFQISAFQAQRLIFSENLSFPTGTKLKVGDENITVIVPPNHRDYLEKKVKFRPLIIGKKTIDISLVLKPMLELLSERKRRGFFTKEYVKKVVDPNYFPERPKGEIFLFREISQFSDYLGKSFEKFKNLLNSDKLINIELQQEYFKPGAKVLVLGVLKRFKNLELSDQLKDKLRRELGLTDDHLVITAEKGYPFLIFEGEIEDFVTRYVIKKGFSKETTIIMGSISATFVSLLLWGISVLTIDPSGKLWPAVALTLLTVIPYSIHLGNQAGEIRKSLMLDELLERKVSSLVE